MEKKIGLKTLKEDLYSEEIYLKYKMIDKIKDFDTVLKKEDDHMASKTGVLRETLDRSRKKFKTDLSNSYAETIDSLNKNENRTPEEDSLFMEVLYIITYNNQFKIQLAEESEIKTELEKVYDTIEDKINILVQLYSLILLERNH